MSLQLTITLLAIFLASCYLIRCSAAFFRRSRQQCLHGCSCSTSIAETADLRGAAVFIPSEKLGLRLGPHQTSTGNKQETN